MSIAMLAISIDCADAEQLAGFWAAVLGRSVSPGASAKSARVATDDVTVTGPLLAFNQVPEGKTVKNRVHLDLSTSEGPVETERLVRLGATVVRVFEENGRHRWTTFADPEGNEFDLVSI
jgi:predicted enzyme related to lactoylglutathione lyase